MDSWHDLKKLEKSLQHVEAKRDHGRTWHSDLDDKPHAIRVHVSHCLKHCHCDAERFRISFINAINHYNSDHSGCPEASHCKTDTAAGRLLIIRKKPIFSEKAMQLLRDAMEKSNVYKNANLNLENMSTALVEFQNDPKCHP